MRTDRISKIEGVVKLNDGVWMNLLIIRRVSSQAARIATEENRRAAQNRS